MTGPNEHWCSACMLWDARDHKSKPAETCEVVEKERETQAGQIVTLRRELDSLRERVRDLERDNRAIRDGFASYGRVK